MQKLNQTAEKLKLIQPGAYIKKADKLLITKNLETIKPNLNATEQNQVDTIIKIISKQKFEKGDRKKFRNVKLSVINIIKKHHQNNNDSETSNNSSDSGDSNDDNSNDDNSDNDTDDNSNDSNSENNNDSDNDTDDDNINDNNKNNNDLSPNKVEKLLDKKTPRYNKFNNTHPMDGVSYDKSNNVYKIIIADFTGTNKNLNIACKKAASLIKKKFSEKQKILSKNLTKVSFMYKNNYFISYLEENNLYFDIQHIICMLTLKTTARHGKYNEFNDKIKLRILHKNEYGGFIVRELLSDEDMYSLVLSSNSQFSKSFKTNVAKILADLRKSNGFMFTNDEIKVRKFSRNNEEYASMFKINQFDELCTYSSKKDFDYAMKLINDGRKIPLGKYL